MRLVLVSDQKGVLVGYELVGPKTGEERQAVVDLACGQPGAILFADKGLWGRELEAMLDLTEVELITPERHRLGEHLAKTVGGLVQRVAQRLLALTLGIFCNLLAGRPARALVAYDGR
jgi:hypothetical protein